MFYSPHPLLRKRETETATVSYSELLFDLIYVFSVTQLSHYLLHNLTWEGLLKETILWFAVWMLWQHTIWVTNWFNPDTRPIRILLFISMLVGLVMAADPTAVTIQTEGFICTGEEAAPDVETAIQLAWTEYEDYDVADAAYDATAGMWRIHMTGEGKDAVAWINTDGITQMIVYGTANMCGYPRAEA